MKADEINILNEKAETRKDGVYSFKKYMYVVKNHKFIGYADCFGYCYQREGSFNISIGKVDRYERKRQLTKWLHNQYR